MNNLLFDSAELWRRPATKRMRVEDAGSGMIHFVCPHCGHDNGWVADEWSITENKRGLPCPKCNETSDG